MLVLVLEVTEVSGFRGELLVEVGCFIKVFLDLELVELSLLILILDLLLKLEDVRIKALDSVIPTCNVIL